MLHRLTIGKQTQKLTVPGMCECPDLMELSVVNIENEKNGVLSADGYYQVGHFDGRDQYRAGSSDGTGHQTPMLCRQSYSGVGDQVISSRGFVCINERKLSRTDGMPMRSLRKTKRKNIT